MIVIDTRDNRFEYSSAVHHEIIYQNFPNVVFTMRATVYIYIYYMFSCLQFNINYTNDILYPFRAIDFRL